MNYDELLKRLTDMLEKLGNGAKTVGDRTWSLLVEAQQATALAELISAAIGTVFGLLLVRLTWRMARMSGTYYLEARDRVRACAAADREKGVGYTQKYADPSGRASVLIPAMVAAIAAYLATEDARYVWSTVPMAIAQYRHPAAFVAREAVERALPPKK